MDITSSGEAIIERHLGYPGKDIPMLVIRAFFNAQAVVSVYIGDPCRHGIPTGGYSFPINSSEWLS